MKISARYFRVRIPEDGHSTCLSLSSLVLAMVASMSSVLSSAWCDFSLSFSACSFSLPSLESGSISTVTLWLLFSRNFRSRGPNMSSPDATRACKSTPLLRQHVVNRSTDPPFEALSLTPCKVFVAVISGQLKPENLEKSALVPIL